MISVRLLASVVIAAALAGCGADAPAPVTPAPAAAPVSAPAPAVVTQDLARELIVAFEAAQKRESIEDTARYLADDVVFHDQAVPLLKLPEKTYGKAEALEQMRKLIEESTERAYSSQIRVIRVASDQKSATADLSIVSHFTAQSGALVTTSDQVYTVAFRGSELKIVAIDSRATSLSANGNTVRL